RAEEGHEDQAGEDGPGRSAVGCGRAMKHASKLGHIGVKLAIDWNNLLPAARRWTHMQAARSLGLRFILGVPFRYTPRVKSLCTFHRRCRVACPGLHRLFRFAWAWRTRRVSFMRVFMMFAACVAISNASAPLLAQSFPLQHI